MSVKLRLMRLGAHKQPFYRVVAVDSRTSRNGAYLEELGFYNSTADPATVKIHEDLVIKWLNKGAVPTATVRSLLRHDGILQRWGASRGQASAGQTGSELSSEALLARELAIADSIPAESDGAATLAPGDSTE